MIEFKIVGYSDFFFLNLIPILCKMKAGQQKWILYTLCIASRLILQLWKNKFKDSIILVYLTLDITSNFNEFLQT